MSEEHLLTSISCPSCGGIVAADSRFCKHCAFDFATAPQPLPQTAASGNSAQTKNRYVLLAVGGLATMLLLTLLTVFIYRSRHNQAPLAAAPSQTMGERAKQVEAQILNGATLSNADLAGLSAYELRVLRNVHFARYGRGYERPGLGDYFYTRPWYKPDANYNDKLLTATDKANINLVLAQENQAKTAEAAAAATNAPILSNAGSSLGAVFNAGLTTEKVQHAVDRLLDWTRKGGSGVRVLGIQEIPQQNQAKADLRFDEFLYNATELGTPVSKDKAPPPKPDRDSPNFWSDLGKSVTQQVRITRYSGDGVAVLKHYNDGRWVLTSVHFGTVAVNGNVEIR